MIRSAFVFFGLILLAFSGAAQLQVETRKHNFGEVYEEDSRVFDFKMTNTSEKKIYILRADVDKELDVKYTTKTLMPDSSAIMRVQVNPATKGRFHKKFPLHVSSSNEPIYFTVDADIKFVPNGVYTPCPDFNSTDPSRGLDFNLSVHVTDSATGLPLKGVEIKLLQSGFPLKPMISNNRGYAKKTIRTGPYYVIVQTPGYKPIEFPTYLNKAGREKELVLSPIEITPIEPELAETTIIPGDDVEEPPVETIVPQDTITPEPQDISTSTELPRDKYRPNNIVLLVDVSTSMKQEGRLDLLKASMIEMVIQLRDIDRVAIVEYASKAGVVMHSRPVGRDKDEIISIIQNLKAGGATAGGKGIHLAYNVAQREFINGGNNQVIIATDGAFDQKGGKIIREVQQNAAKGITISVVGVKNERWTIKSMKAIAAEGKGHYIHIESYEQSRTLLLDEIKLNSAIH